MKTTLENNAGFRFLLPTITIYMSFMVMDAILTYRYVGSDSLFFLGGLFGVPLIFIIEDIIAEIYGYNFSINLIFSAFVAQTLVILFAQIIVTAPYPSFSTEHASYNNILGTSLLKTDLRSAVAYIAANIINARLLTQWKTLLKGRYFWMRVVGSSMIAAAIYTIFFIGTAMYSHSTQNILKTALFSYLIKIAGCIILAIPATFLVDYVKKVTGIDVYDLPVKFSSFTFFRGTMDDA